jgi:PhnB protein
MTIYPQLNFGGNCEEAFRFYEQHLGGKLTTLIFQKDLPSQNNAPEEIKHLVAHARLSLGSVELIENDVPPGRFQPIRSSYLYLSLDSTEQADRVWGALADGGQATMPIAETFFATRFGQLRDRFGVLWSIIHPRAMRSPTQ